MTSGLSGSGRVSRVEAAGIVKRTAHCSLTRCCATGAVIAIFSLCDPWDTGAVIAIFTRERLPPEM